VKHDYPSLIDQIAPTLVTKPLSSVLEKLPFNYIAPWVSRPLSYEVLQNRMNVRFINQVKYREAYNSAFEVVLETIRHKTIHADNPYPSLLCTSCYFRAFSEVQRIKHLTSVKDMLAAVNEKEVTSDGLPCDCRLIRLNSVLVIRLMLKKELERIPKFLHQHACPSGEKIRKLI